MRNMVKLLDTVDITVGAAFGGKGGGVKKVAEDYADNYAVKLITDPDTLRVLADLPVYNEADKTHKVATLNIATLASIGYKGSTVGGAALYMNRVINTIEIPIVAMTAVSEEAKKNKVKHTIKQGINTNDEREDVVADLVKLVRYGTEFDETKYATTRAGRKNAKDEIINNADSPEGLVEYLENWVQETAADFDPELITAIGLDRKMKQLGIEFTIEE